MVVYNSIIEISWFMAEIQLNICMFFCEKMGFDKNKGDKKEKIDGLGQKTMLNFCSQDVKMTSTIILEDVLWRMFPVIPR